MCLIPSDSLPLTWISYSTCWVCCISLALAGNSSFLWCRFTIMHSWTIIWSFQRSSDRMWSWSTTHKTAQCTSWPYLLCAVRRYIIQMCRRNRGFLEILLSCLVKEVAFCNGHPTCFDVSVYSAPYSRVLTHSAITSGFAALRGKMEKDAWHKRQLVVSFYTSGG